METIVDISKKYDLVSLSIHSGRVFQSSAVDDGAVADTKTEILPSVSGKRWFVPFWKIQVLHMPDDAGTGYTVLATQGGNENSIGSLHFVAGTLGQELYAGRAFLCDEGTAVRSWVVGGSFTIANANVHGVLI